MINIKVFFLLFIYSITMTYSYAQLSNVKFNEKKIIICYKDSGVRLLNAKILTSINSPGIATCAIVNSGSCSGLISPTIQKSPVTNMNFPAYGPTPYFISEKGKRCQFLVKAKDINPTNGAYYSIIKSLSFYVTSLQGVSQVNIPNYKIKLKCTDSIELAGNFFPTSGGPPSDPTNGFITVFNVPAWLKHTFPLATSFAWDGKKNIIIDVCFDGLTPPSLINPILSGRRNMPYLSSLYSSSSIKSLHCGNDTLELDGTNNYLPDLRFEICQPVLPIANYNITWNIINQPTPANASMLLPNNPATITNTIKMNKNGTYQIEIIAQNKTNPADISKDTVTIELKSIIRPIFNFKNDTVMCSNDDTLLLSERIKPKGGKFTIVGSSGGGLFQTNNPPSAYFNPKLCFTFAPLFNTIRYTVTDSPCVYGDSTRRISLVFFRESEILNDPGKPICWEDKNLTLEPKLFFAFPDAEFFGPNVDVITGEFKHKLAGVGTHYIGYSTINSKNRCGERDSIKVKVVPRPQFLIGPSELDGCAPFKVCFNTVGPSILKAFDWRYHVNDSFVVDKNMDTVDTIEIFDSSKLATPCTTFYSEGLNKVTLIAIDENQCSDLVEKYVNVLPVPNASFTSSKKEITNVFSEVMFRNKTGDAQKFVWKIEDVLSLNRNDTLPFKYDFVDRAGTYVVSLTATNESNCSSTVYDTIVVTSDYRFYIPTAFNLRSPSPNNVFKFSLGDVAAKELFTFEVFDKWGGKIFESTKNGDYWNGKKNNTGALCGSGLYLWQLTFKDVAKKTQQKSGTILLID
jgi:hypothetical protein